MREVIQTSANLQNRMHTLLANYLEPRGWLLDVPRDAQGYLPWYTYPCIGFLRDIINPRWRVLEYGGGYSTLFYHSHVQEVVTVEDDSAWVEQIRKLDRRAQPRIVVRNTESAGAANVMYQQFVAENFALPSSGHEELDHYHGLANAEYVAYMGVVCEQPQGYYDLIAVDGRARSLCAYAAAHYVSDDGYIILDNSDRHHYNSVQEWLLKQGFGRIDFWGTGPLNNWEWCTSVFSRRFQIENRRRARTQRAGPIL
jgi:hypothetical protein